jgi:hypothetical protein
VEPSDLPNTIVGERCGSKYTYNPVDDWKNYSNGYSSPANSVCSGIQVLMAGFLKESRAANHRRPAFSL